ncbi:MAG: DUF6058 family natural product biosynthesis protein [Candidatus Eremiobacteraeota bacterium]|nr:DUF6058 family natural product biosynthesis protein [Candidatus Eremiobacteraeota bacterium]
MSIKGMALSAQDQEYVVANYSTLAEACKDRQFSQDDVGLLMLSGRLPMPSYVLPDGTLMVPADYFQLLDEAGSLEALQSVFRQRLYLAAQSEGMLMDEDAIEATWFGYLQGHFGLCLRSVTPENIVLKAKLIECVQKCLLEPAPAQHSWCDRLRDSVEKLAAIEREFAEYDSVRFARQPSRFLYVDQVRGRFPKLFRRVGLVAPAI